MITRSVGGWQWPENEGRMFCVPLSALRMIVPANYDPPAAEEVAMDVRRLVGIVVE